MYIYIETSGDVLLPSYRTETCLPSKSFCRRASMRIYNCILEDSNKEFLMDTGSHDSCHSRRVQKPLLV